MRRISTWLAAGSVLTALALGYGCRHGGVGALTDGGTLPPDSGTTPLPDGGTTKLPDGGIVVGTVTVTQHHNHASRDGVYVDPAMTPAAIASMKVDTGFSATTSSLTFAQPLYLENGVTGKPTLFVVTEADDVYALDATSGVQLWKVSVGSAADQGDLDCGDIGPLGLTSTPVLDPTARRLYVAGVDKSSGSVKHTVWGIDIDSHTVAWTLDVASAIGSFDSTVYNQRSALLLLNGILYVPYSGLDGDCGNYKGTVLAIDTAHPSTATAWRAAAYSGSGIWAPTGAASDGTSVFVATGNTNDRTGEGHPFPTDWTQAHSEAVLRLTPPKPTFSGNATDYFYSSGPTNHDWMSLDENDADIGSSGVVLFDAPGATPSHLAFAIGKTQSTYLLNRDNLGGKGLGLGNTSLATSKRVFGSLIAYNTPTKTFVGGELTPSDGSCKVSGADFSVLAVSHASPPLLSFAWCGVGGGHSSAMVSTTDGTNNAVVWTYGSSADEKLRAYDGTTGTLLYTSSALPSSNVWVAPIVAKGRVYVAGNGTVTALKL